MKSIEQHRRGRVWLYGSVAGAALAIGGWGLARLPAAGAAALGRTSNPGAVPVRCTVPTPPADAAGPRPHVARTVHFDLLADLLAAERRSPAADACWRQLAAGDASCRVATQAHPLLGQPAPVFTLTDQGGQPWNLAERLAAGPLVLVFYLGYSCNACVHNLVELSVDRDRFAALGAEIVAVSSDAPEFTREQFERFGALKFPVLSDPEHRVAEAYDTLRPADAGKSAVPLHATFIVGQDGCVQWAQCGDLPFRGNMSLLYELNRLRGGRAAAAYGEQASP